MSSPQSSDGTAGGSRRAIGQAVALGAGCIIATVIILWVLPIPLGVAGEWTWSRVPYSIEIPIAWAAGLLGLALYLAVVWQGDVLLQRSNSRSMRGVAIAMLVVASAIWWNLIMWMMPGGYGYGRAPIVLYNPGSSGYFLQARNEASNLRSFLAEYETLLSEEDHLHIGTHPPGLTAGLRVLLGACRRSPSLRSVILATEPSDVREAFRIIRTTSGERENRLSEADEACLWGAACVVEVVFLLGAVFLYQLVRLDHSAHVAWRVAVLWPLIPGAWVFFPKSDLLFPTIGLACACAWFYGLRRRSALLCTLAGVIAWGGMMLSLAMGPILIMIALATLWMRPWKNAPSIANTDGASQPISPAALMAWIGWGASGFLLPVIALWAWSGLNLFAVWSWNFHNHALFYVHFRRTWLAWLLVNPLEFAMTLGLPITAFVLLAGVSLMATWRRLNHSASAGLIGAWCLVLGGLWLTGKNMGEAARLWLVFTPWPMLALPRLIGPKDAGSSSADTSRIVWMTLLISQAVCCLLTLTRVDGFQFDQFHGPS